MNNAGAGPTSAQVTILVGDVSQKPACILTASPASINQNEKATLLASCHPAPSSYQWGAVDSGAPQAPGTDGAELTFTNAGIFTYKVQGVNAIGAGATASATVSVAGTGPPAGTNLIVNGGFEFPVLAAGTYVSPFNSSSWTASPGYTGVITSGYLAQNNYPVATEGSQIAFYEATQYLRQTVTLLPGTYSLTFKAMLHTCCTSLIPSVNLNGVRIGNVNGMLPQAWRPASIGFVISAAGTYLLDFTTSTLNGAGYVYIDDVQLYRAP